MLQVAAHPDECATRVEDLAEDLQERSAALQRDQHVPVDTEIGFAH